MLKKPILSRLMTHTWPQLLALAMRKRRRLTAQMPSSVNAANALLMVRMLRGGISGFFSILSAYAQITAATTRVAILAYTMPIWAVLLAWAVLRERPNASQTLAVVLCALGLAVLIYPLAKGGVPLGLLLALAAGAMWGACEGQNFGAPKGALRTPELIRLMGNIKSLCVASSPCSVCIVARC